MTPSIHIPVLADEVVRLLQPREGQVFIDGTLGGCGHCRLLLERVGERGCVIGVDRDPLAIQQAESSLQGRSVILAQASFADIPEVLGQTEFQLVDGILLDLGLSSDQLADASRGFSFHSDGPLDLRFNPDQGEPAWRLMERLSAAHLADLIYQYGEERYSRRIARRIVDARKTRPIRTARQLAELVRKCIPKPKGHAGIDAATRTFQALRIAVNDELKSLAIGLKRLPDCLRTGGRLAVISFHSLEDRLVKTAFREDIRLEVVTSRPVVATEEERARNTRSRSAKLRVAARR
jgi:16S rRNA (cytosine1402-N4)-methyltransferase